MFVYLIISNYQLMSSVYYIFYVVFLHYFKVLSHEKIEDFWNDILSSVMHGFALFGTENTIFCFNRETL